MSEVKLTSDSFSPKRPLPQRLQPLLPPKRSSRIVPQMQIYLQLRLQQPFALMPEHPLLSAKYKRSGCSRGKAQLPPMGALPELPVDLVDYHDRLVRDP